MKTLYSKLLTGAILLFLSICGTANKGYSQFFGLNSYLTTDSVVGSNHCLNDSIEGMIWWTHSGTYIPGDEADFNVDWGDGNNSAFLNVPISSAGSYGYVNPIGFSHMYAVVGSYTIIVTSLDNYSNADADTFLVNVSHLCGNIYTTVYLDNGDAVLGSGDVPMTGVALNLISSGPSYYSTTGASGLSHISDIDATQPSYNLEVDAAWLSTSGMTVIDPVAGNYTITGLNGSPQYNHFLLDCGSSSNLDVSAVGWGWGFRAGMSTGETNVTITTFDCSGTPTTADISLDYDPLLTVFSTSLPGGVITPGNISWTGVNLPFGNMVIDVFYTVPAATPAFTPLAFQVEVNNTSSTDVNPTNNIFPFNSEVRNSWDPNDKSTNVEHYIDVNAQEEIFYTIRFQNMGNDDAYNIHIKDTISTLLDLSTIKVVAQSHAGSYSIDPLTREVIFNFPNIFLVPQTTSEELSQGFIQYKISENPGLALNSDIQNTAHIFFDGNAAVVTNTTSNINVTNPTGVEDESALSSVSLYPVPANTFVHIDGIDPQEITGLKILDLNGKVVQVINTTNMNSNIQVSEIPNGFYLVEITSGINSVVRKICVQH